VVLKHRIRLCCENECTDTIGIANTGFAGAEPEITLPETLARELLGEAPPLILVERVLADGTRVLLPKATKALSLYVVTDDRVEGPVEVKAYVVKSRVVLLNDSALSSLRIVIIDPKEGVWCFRDELGRRERRGLS